MPTAISVIITKDIYSLTFRIENLSYNIHFKNTRLFKLKLYKFLQNIQNSHCSSVIFTNNENDYVKFDHKIDSLTISSGKYCFTFNISGNACKRIFKNKIIM
jgi:hypothetical protein